MLEEEKGDEESLKVKKKMFKKENMKKGRISPVS